MTAMERFANSIVVPVVVLDKAEDAVPTARAMLAGGIDTMEITFRTACAPEAIRAVSSSLAFHSMATSWPGTSPFFSSR